MNDFIDFITDFEVELQDMSSRLEDLTTELSSWAEDFEILQYRLSQALDKLEGE